MQLNSGDSKTLIDSMLYQSFEEAGRIRSIIFRRLGKFIIERIFEIRVQEMAEEIENDKKDKIKGKLKKKKKKKGKKEEEATNNNEINQENSQEKSNILIKDVKDSIEILKSEKNLAIVSPVIEKNVTKNLDDISIEQTNLNEKNSTSPEKNISKTNIETQDPPKKLKNMKRAEKRKRQREKRENEKANEIIVCYEKENSSVEKKDTKNVQNDHDDIITKLKKTKKKKNKTENLEDIEVTFKTENNIAETEKIILNKKMEFPTPHKLNQEQSMLNQEVKSLNNQEKNNCNYEIKNDNTGKIKKVNKKNNYLLNKNIGEDLNCMFYQISHSSFQFSKIISILESFLKNYWFLNCVIIIRNCTI